MDPFSLASGIAGLLSLTIELTQRIGDYVSSVKNHSKSIEELSEKLGMLEVVLKQLKDFLHSEEVKGKKFDQTSTLFIATVTYSRKLQSISDRLKKQTKGNKMSQCLERLKWPFTEDENLETIDVLYGYIQTFHFSLNIGGCTLLSKTSDEVFKTLTCVSGLGVLGAELSIQVSTVVKTISTFPDVLQKLSDIDCKVEAIGENLQNCGQEKKTKDKLEHRGAILQWLSPLTFEDRHKAIRALRQYDTGKWFLRSREFREWSEGDKNLVLWCPGIPGGGKTVITSFVVDYLKATYPGPDIGVAYLYCDYKDKDMQTSINLLSSLTRQLATQLLILPSEIEEFYKSRQDSSSPSPTTRDHLKLLLSLAQKFERTFLVVDALDEGPSDDGFQDWKDLILTVQEAESSIKLLVTSRHQEDIKHIFRTSPQLTIEASSEDVREYITSRITRYKSLTRFTTKDPNLREEIVSAVSDKVKGMFLLARFQMDRLVDQTSVRNIRKALENMPAGYVDTYNDTLSRIQAQCKERAELAIRVLAWIYYARRPLEARELRYALAVESGDDHLHESGLQDVELLLGICGGLVSLDTESGTIRLVHYTIQEYFDLTHDELFPDAKIDIPRTCLTHLLFTESRMLGNMFGVSLVHLPLMRETYPFFSYALRNSIHHLRGEPEAELLDLALRYVKFEGRNNKNPRYRHPIINIKPYVSNFTPLHFATGAGLKTIVHALVDEAENINILDSHSEPPLFWAARNGHDAVVQLLVDKGASTWVLSKNGGAQSVIDVAFEKGHQLPSISRLQEAGLYNSSELQQNVLLHPFVLAPVVEGGREAITQMLLDQGLDKHGEPIPHIFPATIQRYPSEYDKFRLHLSESVKIDIETDWAAKRKPEEKLLPRKVTAVLGNTASVRHLFQKDAAVEASRNQALATIGPAKKFFIFFSLFTSLRLMGKQEHEETTILSTSLAPQSFNQSGKTSIANVGSNATSPKLSTTPSYTFPKNPFIQRPHIAEDTKLRVPIAIRESATPALRRKPSLAQFPRALTHQVHFVPLVFGVSFVIYLLISLGL